MLATTLLAIGLLAAVPPGARGADDDCATLKTFWVSDEYSAERVDKSGAATTLPGLKAELTISSQHGCAFEGFHEWSNGDVGGTEPVAGIISTHGDQAEVVEITMLELGPHPEGGSNGRIDATVENGVMRWRYTGHGSNADTNWVTVFDAAFAADAAPGLDEPDCVDISGTWKTDTISYYRLFEDGRREVAGPSKNTLVLTMEDDCLVSGKNEWDNGSQSGFEYVAGVVHAGERSATLLEIGGLLVDGLLELTLDENNVMALHFLGRSGTAGTDYEVVFDSFLGKDAPPNMDPPACGDIDLVGTWVTPPFDFFEVKGGEDVVVVPEASRSFQILGRDGCTFWGVDKTLEHGDLALLGVIHEDLETASIMEIGHTKEGAGTSAIVDVHIEDGGALKWHYVGSSADGQTAGVFDAVFAKAASDCAVIDKYWVSDPYSAERVDKNGAATTLAGLAATLTVTSQHECAFEGYHEWSNGDIGGKEYVAGIIDDATHITMLELGDVPEGGSAATIEATLQDGIMRWRYIGRGSSPDDKWSTVFDAVFAPDAAPGLTEKDCLDVSGTWKSDEIVYHQLWEDGRYELLGPAHNTFDLRMEDDCLVSGTNSWDNGDETGFEYVAGVVHSGTRALTLLEVPGIDIDGRFEITLDDKNVMALHFVGGMGAAKEMVFDSFAARDAAPNMAKTACGDIDLLGTWTSPPFPLFQVRAGQDVILRPDVEHSFTVETQDGCAFWGTDADGRVMLGLVHEDLETAFIAEVGHKGPVGFSALVEVRLTEEGMKWHYVGLSESGHAGAVFDAIFTKDSDEATPAPTPESDPDGATTAPTPESDSAFLPTPVLWLLVALAAAA